MRSFADRDLHKTLMSQNEAMKMRDKVFCKSKQSHSDLCFGQAPKDEVDRKIYAQCLCPQMIFLEVVSFKVEELADECYSRRSKGW